MERTVEHCLFRYPLPDMEHTLWVVDQIINMVQQLSEVDTTDVPVTTTVTDAFNVMREDIAVKGTDRELLMENVPERKDGFIKVPAIIDESEEG